MDGVSPTGSVGASIQFLRLAIPKGASTGVTVVEPEADVILPPWFLLEREVSLGVQWNVVTTIRRLGETERAAITRVPLLAGESVTSDAVKREGGELVVSFPRGIQTVTWNSTFEIKPEFHLIATDKPRTSENWNLRCSSIFRCAISGLTPTKTSDGQEQVYSWSPWPLEKVTVSASRPDAVSGTSVTTDNLEIAYRPGKQLLAGTATLNIRTSRGGWKKIVFPEGTEIREVKANDRVLNMRPKDRVLSIPLEPGSAKFTITWEQPWNGGLFQRLPALTFRDDPNSGAVNVTSTVAVPQDRVLLLTGGPAWGPAVLFWGALVVVLLFSVILAKSNKTPLSVTSWILLTLGLVTLSPLLMTIPAVWFIALNYRKEHIPKTVVAFNLTQIALAILTLITLAVLYSSVHSGLLFSPDMQVAGQNSSNHFLRWYTDRISTETPSVWFFSIPLWVYHWLVMLPWSAWLVASLIKWLKWAWQSFSTGGLWMHGK